MKSALKRISFSLEKSQGFLKMISRAGRGFAGKLEKMVMV